MAKEIICPLCGKKTTNWAFVVLSEKNFRKLHTSHAELCFDCGMKQEDKR